MAGNKFVRCPKCESRDVRPSSHRGIGDALMAMLFLTPFRCRACDKRFFRRVLRRETRLGQQGAPPQGGGARNAAK
jgi:hypothetical protein